MFINCILQLYREHIIFFLIIRRQSILIFMLEDEVSYHGDNLYKTVDTVIAERDSSEIV